MHRLTRQRLCWLLAVPGVVLPLCGSASVVLLQDPYGANATSCASAACDVIGEKEWFDLDKIELNVTSSLVQIKVYSNFKNSDFSQYTHPGTTLQLGIGDLLFEVDGHYKYGIAITSHAGSVNGGPAGGNVEAGVLYKIANGDAGVMTAEQALQHTQYTYRYADPVWLWKQGDNLINTATGNVSVTNLGTVGAGSTQGYYNLATISFAPTAEFLADYAGNAFELSLASADCANDVLSGYVTGTVPEPGALALFALGLGGLAARRRKRASSGK